MHVPMAMAVVVVGSSVGWARMVAVVDPSVKLATEGVVVEYFLGLTAAVFVVQSSPESPDPVLAMALVVVGRSHEMAG